MEEVEEEVDDADEFLDRTFFFAASPIPLTRPQPPPQSDLSSSLSLPQTTIPPLHSP